MDALYDAPNTKVRIIEHIISRFTKELWRNDSRNISSFVMKEQEARDCYIREKDVAIEIQDGFNNNLVIQHYMEKGNKKNILICIPQSWQTKFTGVGTGGTMCCSDGGPYKGLQMSVI